MIELYDSDVLVYRIGFACEKKRYAVEWHESFSGSPGAGVTEFFDNKRDLNKVIKGWEHNPDLFTVWTEHLVEPKEHCFHALDRTLEAITSRLQGTSRSFYLTGKGNFRYSLATVKPYKGNRDPLHKPVHYKEIRQYLVDKYNAETIDGAEADDALGIRATIDPKNSIIITNDKDLKQIPAWHYDWTKDQDGTYRKPVYVEPKGAKIFFYTQLLTGDATDNIPGLEGCGDVEAGRILAEVNSPIDAETKILKAYRARYGKDEGDKRFLETGSLVRICKTEEEIGTPWKPLVDLNSNLN